MSDEVFRERVWRNVRVIGFVSLFVAIAGFLMWIAWALDRIAYGHILEGTEYETEYVLLLMWFCISFILIIVGDIGVKQSVATKRRRIRVCSGCGSEIGDCKFCPECGKSALPEPGGQTTPPPG